jgi:hypothetical protein
MTAPLTAKPQLPQASILHALPILAELNRRFVAGAPSNSLAAAGVPLHVLDGFEKSATPWVFDVSRPSADRASASIVNARHPDVYENLFRPVGYRRMPGFVLADHPTEDRLLCSYWRDGGTWNRNCDHLDEECRPGCIRWCQEQEEWMCAFQPARLQEIMEAEDREKQPGHHRRWGYNELILDNWRKPWDLNMPEMIRAVFIQTGSEESEVQHALAVHNKLLMSFGLSEADCPLIEYDATSPSEPFRPFNGSRKAALSIAEFKPMVLPERAPPPPPR